MKESEQIQLPILSVSPETACQLSDWLNQLAEAVDRHYRFKIRHYLEDLEGESPYRMEERPESLDFNFPDDPPF